MLFRATVTVNLKCIPIPHWYKKKKSFFSTQDWQALPTIMPLLSNFIVSPFSNPCSFILISVSVGPQHFHVPYCILKSAFSSRGVWCLGLFSYSHRFGSEDACGSFVMPQPTLFCLGLRRVPFMWGHWLPTHWRIVKTLRMPFEHLLWSYKLMISLSQILTITY